MFIILFSLQHYQLGICNISAWASATSVRLPVLADNPSWIILFQDGASVRLSINNNNDINDIIVKRIISLVAFVLHDCRSVVFQIVSRV